MGEVPVWVNSTCAVSIWGLVPCKSHSFYCLPHTVASHKSLHSPDGTQPHNPWLKEASVHMTSVWLKLMKSNLCFHSWTVTRTLQTLAKMGETNTMKSTCSFKLDQVDIQSLSLITPFQNNMNSLMRQLQGFKRILYKLHLQVVD